jgi:hypothetical protein
MIIVADGSPFVVLVSMPECGPEHLDGARTPRGQMRVESGPSGSDPGAAGAQSIELGGNRAPLRPTVQAGGGVIELARRCRSAPFATLVAGQVGGSNRLCVAHWLDTDLYEDTSITLSLEERGRLARSIRVPAPSRQDESSNS